MIKTEVDESLRLTCQRCKGKIIVAEIAEVIQKFYKAGPTLHVLWDLSEADLSSVKSAEIEGLVRIVMLSVHSRAGGRNAIVSPTDISFGLSRVYQSFAEAKDQMTQTRVFRTEDEARQWIREAASE